MQGEWDGSKAERAVRTVQKTLKEMASKTGKIDICISVRRLQEERQRQQAGGALEASLRNALTIWFGLKQDFMDHRDSRVYGTPHEETSV